MEKIEEALLLILWKANFCLANPGKSVVLSSLHSFPLLNIKFPSIHRVRGSTRESYLASFFSGKILWHIWVCPPQMPESGFQSISQSMPFLSSENYRAFHHTWETSQILLCIASVDTRMTVCTLVGLEFWRVCPRHLASYQCPLSHSRRLLKKQTQVQEGWISPWHYRTVLTDMQ